MGRGKSKKDQFASLDTDWKDAAAAMDEVQLRAKVSEVALNQEALLDAKENDTDLASAKETYNTAGAVYKEGTKANKLRTKFLRRCLGDKGKNTGESGQP